MRLAALLPLLLFLPALLSGCVGQDDPLETSTFEAPLDEPPEDDATPDDAPPAEQAEAEGEETPEPDEDAALDDSLDEEPPAPREVEVNFTGRIESGAGLCTDTEPLATCHGVVEPERDAGDLEAVAGTIRKFRIEVTWESETLATDTLRLAVQTCGVEVCATHTATGTSPLVIDVEDAEGGRDPSIRISVPRIGNETVWLQWSLDQEYEVHAAFTLDP